MIIYVIRNQKVLTIFLFLYLRNYLSLILRSNDNIEWWRALLWTVRTSTFTFTRVKWFMSSSHSTTFSVTSPTSQLILQSFRRFTYVTAHSSTFSLLHLRHSSFSNPSFASPTSQALHLNHLASRPCINICLFRHREKRQVGF